MVVCQKCLADGIYWEVIMKDKKDHSGQYQVNPDQSYHNLPVGEKPNTKWFHVLNKEHVEWTKTYGGPSGFPLYEELKRRGVQMTAPAPEPTLQVKILDVTDIAGKKIYDEMVVFTKEYQIRKKAVMDTFGPTANSQEASMVVKVYYQTRE